MNLKKNFVPHSGKSFRHLSILLAAILLAGGFRTYGINASPTPIHLIQPDGTAISLRVRGDEFSHWFEDTAGFAVVRDAGRYVYAQRRADGGLGPTAFVVGRDNPRALNLQENLRPSPQFLRGERQRLQASTSAATTGQTAPVATPGEAISRIAPLGTVKNLVILCRFSDHLLGRHTRAPSDYNVLMNTVGGDPLLAPSGSLKDFYREASYGRVTVESTVIAWVTLPHTEQYYANGVDGFGNYPQNGQGMVKDALDAADLLVNFGQFDTDNDGFIDAIDFIHSGYGAETGGGDGNWIWSHKWSLFQIPGGRWTSTDRNANNVFVKVFDYHTEPALWSTTGTNITRVGVVAHETGHFFGLPDLYDTDNSSEGAGSYCLMANSWGFDNTQLHPPHPSAWTKIQLGWVTPITIAPGTYNVPRVESTNIVYRITNGYPNNEYLLIENRQAAGFESDIPQGGLAIWHIDDNVSDIIVNDNEGYPGSFGWPADHYQVGLIEADGAFHLERGINRGDAGDVYRGGGVSTLSGVTVPSTDGYQSGALITTANVITNISASASNMTFTFANPRSVIVPTIQIVAVDATIISETYTPTNRALDPGETVNVRFRLRNNGSATASVTATLLPNAGVLLPGAAQVYTLSNNGTIGARTYTYIAGGPCGSSITNVLQLQVAGTNIGTVSFVFLLGAPVTRLSQNFEGNKPPALPINWQSSPSDSNGWSTVTGFSSSPTNSVFAPNLPTVSDALLTSPSFFIGSTNAILSFPHRYDTEYGFDGGVLEISINNGPFSDILTAGGTFIANGYNFFIDLSFGNPLAGRDAWTGNSTNFLNTTVKLPTSVTGKNVRLRWRMGSDSSVTERGWYVDSISVTEHACQYPATLPAIVNAQLQNTNVVFMFNTRTGISYAIEYTDAITNTVWTPLSVQVGNGFPCSVTNNITVPKRFYRLREL